MLEAFGNAQTLMNDNSSRFGKFIELRFNEKLVLEGALMSEYLLEKSRIVNQADGERNFHVFYLIFANLTPEKQKKYQLKSAGQHRFDMHVCVMCKCINVNGMLFYIVFVYNIYIYIYIN